MHPARGSMMNAECDPVTYWSRRQFIYEEVDEHVTRIHASAADLLPPTFFRTRKQAQRMRMRQMSDDERHRHARRHGSAGKKVVPVSTTPLLRRESVKKRGSVKGPERSTNTMEVLKHDEMLPVESKRRSRRSRRREPEREQGTWREVKQAGVTFWVNDTTGVADEDPPPVRNSDGSFQPRKKNPAPTPYEDDMSSIYSAEEIVDDDSIGDLSFSFLDDWTKEKKYSRW